MPDACLIASWRGAAGAWAVLAGALAKREARSAIEGERGASGVGQERGKGVVGKEDGSELLRNDVG